MTRGERREAFRSRIERHWRRVFNFAFRMTLDRAQASSLVGDTFRSAYLAEEVLPDDEEQAEERLLQIAHRIVEKRLPRIPDLTFDLLDDTLRSEATRTDVVRSVTDPQRDFLLWELKQGCMTAVINCLSPGERAAFVAANVLALGEDKVANVLGITASACKVRLSRARKKVTEYLASRCEHVEPMNPCRCPARVGVAVKKGFIRSGGEVDLRGSIVPFGRYGTGPDAEDEPQRDVVAIYRNLPDPDAPKELPDSLLSALEQGAWDELRDKKQTG